MAKLKVKIPKLGLTIETVKLIEWLKQPGDPVAQGEAIATIEADKANFEIEAPAAGVLIEHLAPASDEDELDIGTEIAVIDMG
jgi:pyruvate/2-oxoglutarate dehydrogenase complex dihydrolipoamide acyltransferase (E2) component